MLGGVVSESVRPLWWLVVYPGLAITLTVLAFNLFGDALRDVLDQAGNPLTPEEQEAKLRRVGEVARRVWG